MDAYTPLPDSFTPYASVTQLDEPWRSGWGTQTVVFFKGPAPTKTVGTSSLGSAGDLSFVLIDTPVLAGLDRLRTFRDWQDNWDAEGARAPDVETLNAASKVFSLLAAHSVPNVTLDSDGQPMLVFNGTLRGEVVMTSPSTLDYFFMDDDAPYGENATFVGDQLPPELVSYIKALA